MTVESPILLQCVTSSELGRRSSAALNGPTVDAARTIVNRVRVEGAAAVRGYAEQFAERGPDEPLVLDKDCMKTALDALPDSERGALQRTATRIRTFAQAQRAAIAPVDIEIPGGRAGHTIEPVESAGCYAPAGTYPLVSSVLMTAITARVAGCKRVVVASPGSSQVMLAAAAIAEADEFLAVGGAHAIASLAHGIDGFDPVDVIVGPGNKWVTAAKHIVSDTVGIDMLAGPSELLIIADDSAHPATVAADLLAQAEHDIDAVPMLLTTSRKLQVAVERELVEQLAGLPTAKTSRVALGNGFSCLVASRAEALRLADLLAAEHVELLVEDPASFASAMTNAGAVFIGAASAEVLGDFGAGPNHTLPTGRSARFRAGLSVNDFIRLRTWVHVADASGAQDMIRDAAALARMEGLPGHERAATRRSTLGQSIGSA